VEGPRSVSTTSIGMTVVDSSGTFIYI